jgi:spermidine synthase
MRAKMVVMAGVGLLALSPLLLLAQASGRVVHRVKSEFQEIVVVDTPNGFRRMLFDPKFNGSDAIQSEMKKSMPTELTLSYARHMMAALPLVEKPGGDERILVIGLGGACMQRYLVELLPKATIETAELDPAVLDVAKGFFGLVLDERQKVTVGDGRKFIEGSKDKYDLILLDAFSATSIPYPLATKEFLEACKAHLNEGGVVCTNLWQTLPEYPDMLRTYDVVFPERQRLRCGGGWNNIILVAPREKRGLTKEKWAGLAKAYEKSHKMTLPIGTMVEEGYMEEGKLPVTAKVLLDKKD